MRRCELALKPWRRPPRREPYYLERGGGRSTSAAFRLSKRSVSLRPHGAADLPAHEVGRVDVHVCVAGGDDAQGSGEVAGGEVLGGDGLNVCGGDCSRDRATVGRTGWRPSWC